jgi:transposase
MGLEMSECLGIDSPFRGWAMPKSYSADLRERVMEAVEMGASRHEAADRFEVSVSSAVRWLQRWQKSRSAAPKPRGGSVSPLESAFAMRKNAGYTAAAVHHTIVAAVASDPD